MPRRRRRPLSQLGSCRRSPGSVACSWAPAAAESCRDTASTSTTNHHFNRCASTLHNYTAIFFRYKYDCLLCSGVVEKSLPGFILVLSPILYASKMYDSCHRYKNFWSVLREILTMRWSDGWTTPQKSTVFEVHGKEQIWASRHFYYAYRKIIAV